MDRMHLQPLVSIVTPSFNQGQFIERTIESVLSQTYPNIEYIVMDGGSGDETIEVIDRYKSRIDVVDSKPDKGQADAIQQGFSLAQGTLVGWINSDDTLTPDSVAAVVRQWNIDSSVSMLYGDVDVIDEHDRNIGRLKLPNSITYQDLVNRRTRMAQPGSFYPKHLVEKVGGIREQFHLMMDKDLWLRLTQASVGVHVGTTVASFRKHDGAKTIRPTWRHVQERLLLRKQHKPRILSYQNFSLARMVGRYALGRLSST